MDQVQEHYARKKDAGQGQDHGRRLADQLIEHYARKKPGHGQKSLFGDEPVQSHQHQIDWDEKQHPRESDGEFAQKGEGQVGDKEEEKKEPSEKAKAAIPLD